MRCVVCPSLALIGSMGKPVKITAKGKTFFLCCAHCETKFKEDPDKVLAKLN